MVLLAGLVWLPTWTVGAVGLIVIVLQMPSRFLGSGAAASPGGRSGSSSIRSAPNAARCERTLSRRPLLDRPWIGVMAAGLCVRRDHGARAAARRRLCLAIGLTATALFVVGAGLAGGSGARADDAPPALFRFLNQRNTRRRSCSC